MRHERRKFSPDKSRRGKSGSGGYFFIRRGTGLTLSNGNLKMENLTHGTDSKALEATVVTAEPGAYCEETEIYLGEKWFYILEGKLEILVNNASFLLSEGDSIYLESTAAHRWRNPHKGKTRALVFSSPQSLPV
jgi:quercetin dioxygenase-like cupin family protein